MDNDDFLRHEGALQERDEALGRHAIANFDGLYGPDAEWRGDPLWKGCDWRDVYQLDEWIKEHGRPITQPWWKRLLSYARGR